MVSGKKCGVRLVHALGHAADLHRMCVVNQIGPKSAARSLGLPPAQVKGAVRLLKSLPQLPSPERLALVVQRDYGLDDDDVGEMFGRSGRWSALVRSRAVELRDREPIAERLEWLEDGLQPDHPSPLEIRARALAVRLARPPARQPEVLMGVTGFQWSDDLNEFFPVCG